MIKTQEAVMANCWNPAKGMIADTPDQAIFSQHANVLAVLTNTVELEEQPSLMEKVLSDESIAQCSYYFRFYLSEALRKTGQGNLYLETLKPWQTMLDNGLTTFAEQDEPSRSDCHAWSASPLYHFYSIVAGIIPATPGFEEIRMSPNLGALKKISGVVPHRSGEIRFDLKREARDGIKGQVTLPSGLTGSFVWNEKEIKLQAGINSIDM